jgi:hypothetical protein
MKINRPSSKIFRSGTYPVKAMCKAENRIEVVNKAKNLPCHINILSR